jgi:hypothetical protein
MNWAKSLLTIGNITKDTMVDIGVEKRYCGGAVYPSLAASNLHLDSVLLTRGNFITDREMLDCAQTLHNEGVKIKAIVDKHNTEFINDYSSGTRIQKLVSYTDKIDYETKASEGHLGKFDVIILNPVFCEINSSVPRFAKKDCDIMLMDPQGMVRTRETQSGEIGLIYWHDREKYLEHLDILKVSSDELMSVSKLGDCRDICEELYSLGPGIIALTFGENGSIVYDGNELHAVPAYRTHSVDPTGAGDLFNVYFAVRYFETNDARDAGIYANAGASFVVEDYGISGIPMREDIDARYRALKRKTDENGQMPDI